MVELDDEVVPPRGRPGTGRWWARDPAEQPRRREGERARGERARTRGVRERTNLSFAPKAKANQLVVLRTTSEKSPTKCFKALQARNTHARNEAREHARKQGLDWFGLVELCCSSSSPTFLVSASSSPDALRCAVVLCFCVFLLYFNVLKRPVPPSSYTVCCGVLCAVLGARVRVRCVGR